MKEIQSSKEYNEKTGKWETMSFKQNKKGEISVAPKYRVKHPKGLAGKMREVASKMGSKRYEKDEKEMGGKLK